MLFGKFKQLIDTIASDRKEFDKPEHIYVLYIIYKFLHSYFS